MKKCKKIVSILSCMAMAVNLLPGISAMADNETSTLLASDKTTNWAMQWSWERHEAGWDYYSDWTLTNGFEITYDKDKYNELKAVAYPTKDEGATQSDTVGEHKYAFKTNADGKAVAFDAQDAENTNLWFHQGRQQFISKFTITGDDSADTRPVVVKFKYKIDNTYDQTWQMSYIQVAGLKLYANETGIGFDNKTTFPDLTAPPTTSDNSHDVVMKFVPDATENKLKLDYFLVDQTAIDVATTARYASKNIDSIETSGHKDSAAGTHDGPAHYVKNLEVYRGIPNITASSTTADNATGVDLAEGVTISFSDAVTLEDGAITLLKNGVEQAATVTPSEDKKSATVTLAGYEEKTGYQIKVDKTKVSNVLGGTLAEDYILNFVTAKQLVSYTPSENMFDINNVAIAGVGSYDGSRFATVEKNVANNSFTVTVDNKSWTEAYKNQVTSGNNGEVGKYGAYLDNGEYKAIGFNVIDWGDDYDNAKVNLGIKETENNGKPIYVSFDYTVTGPSGANAQLHLGDTRNRPYFTYISVSDTAAHVSQATWGASKISGNENCSTGHIEYAVYPSEGSLDGTVFKAPQWAAFNGATSINKTTDAPYDSGSIDGQEDYYAKEVGVYVPRKGPAVSPSSQFTGDTTDLANTVITFSNVEVRRVNDFTSAVNDNVADKDDPTLTVLFSDKVKAEELDKIKVYQGVTEVNNAISSSSLASDGLSATVTLNKDDLATGKYTLNLSELVNAYNVASKTTDIPFEYYAEQGVGDVTISAATRAGSTVSYTLSNNTTETKTGIVIAAAYGADDRLIDVSIKPMTIQGTANLSDTIVFENDISKAVKFKLMVWDSITNIKPYSMAFDVQ